MGYRGPLPTVQDTGFLTYAVTGIERIFHMAPMSECLRYTCMRRDGGLPCLPSVCRAAPPHCTESFVSRPSWSQPSYVSASCSCSEVRLVGHRRFACPQSTSRPLCLQASRAVRSAHRRPTTDIGCGDGAGSRMWFKQWRVAHRGSLRAGPNPRLPPLQPVVSASCGGGLEDLCAGV